MLSYTNELSLGQYNGSVGKGIENLIVELRVGLGPGGPGSVLIFYTAYADGGTKDFTLKFIKAFLIGRIPGDSSYLRPKISILTSHSFILTLDARSTPEAIDGLKL